MAVARGAGLTAEEAEKALLNSKDLLTKILKKSLGAGTRPHFTHIA